MGNCSLKGVVEDCPHNIRILTDYGDIVEFKGPKLAKDVLHEYPGYSIFRQGHASSPLSTHEYLLGGQFYYLLPLQNEQRFSDTEVLSQIHDVGLAKKKVAMEWINETEPPKDVIQCSSNGLCRRLSNRTGARGPADARGRGLESEAGDQHQAAGRDFV
ncbi:hypothetical protein OIU84_022102 [Salix udensis]|uniref:Uncharacterized protein n=1 Tax=Salix udensis TaxID=889485 RepID=A0AAD6KQ28_9ROSI|nr:hypothetical protein OIU84_022102 [Salix udensis]